MSKDFVVGTLKVAGAAVAFTYGGPWAAAAWSVAWGYLEYKKIKGGPSLVESQQAVQLNAATNEGALPIIYGQAKVGISLVDLRVQGSDDNILAVVGAIALAPEGGDTEAQQGIKSIEKVYFDEVTAIDGATFGINSAGNNPITTNAKEPWFPTGASTFGTDYWLQYFAHDGDDSQIVDYELKQQFSTQWSDEARGRGIAYIVLWLYLKNDVYTNGLPNVTVLVKGNKVADVTNLDADFDYSFNPADCIYDFMTSTRYGMGIPAAQMNTASFSAASTVCDTAVTVTLSDTTTVTLDNKYECHGWLDSAADPKTNLERLLSSCQGRIVREAGEYHLLIRKDMVPTPGVETFELNRTNIVGEWNFIRSGIDATPNVMGATYVDADQSYQPDTVTWPEPGNANSYLTADNSYLSEGHMELPFTVNRYMAEMIAAQTLLETRADMGCALVAQREALKLAVGDVVNVNHDTPNWTDQTMWVEEIGIRKDGLVQLVLKEYDDAAYTIPTLAKKPTLVASGLPPYYTSAPISTVQVLNLNALPRTIGEIGSTGNQGWNVDLEITFGPGALSFNVQHVASDDSYDYQYDVTTPTFVNQFLRVSLKASGDTSDPTTVYDFTATTSGSSTAYDVASTVVITPYDKTGGAAGSGTAGEKMSVDIVLDADTGAVGVRVQATTNANLILPGQVIKFPATGGMLAGRDTGDGNPTVSLNIMGVDVAVAAGSSDYLIFYDSATGALKRVAVNALPYEPLS
tara:strand:- start:1766 stop:4000 length:2235 start_codon:yes stop_codon:yes gene_type:complete